ncbi:ferredoxin reductase domain-containing protein [Methylobacterium fujisawaense]|uniref:oxidoreductase n=1 Tax=Methylobacterium fujisawaense TaxID=107400 RepID=UPI0036FA0451
MTIRLLPRHAPFESDALVALDQVLAAASREQRTWLSDHLAAAGGLPGRGTKDADVSVGEVVEYVNLNSSRSDRTTMHVAVAFPDGAPPYGPESVLDLVGIDGESVPARVLPVASSRREVADEVHALMPVGADDASVAERLRLGSQVAVRLREDARFHLPAEPGTDVIMIGVEAGVAPYRALTQERRALGAGGRSWLFFGGRRFTHDFFYQLEWQAALADRSLTRMDVAFSHDQPERVGVEDRLLERREELVAWIENGASLSICAAPESAERARSGLLKAIADVKACSTDVAGGLVAEMASQGRFSQRHP